MGGHPQDMHPKVETGPESDGSLQLLDERAGTLEGRVVTIVLQNKTGDPVKDRDNRDPEFHKKDLNENWTRNRRDVLESARRNRAHARRRAAPSRRPLRQMV